MLTNAGLAGKDRARGVSVAFKCERGVDTATGCDGGAEAVVAMAVGAAVLVAAAVVLCLASGEKSGDGMRETGSAAEAIVGEDGLRCEG